MPGNPKTLSRDQFTLTAAVVAPPILNPQEGDEPTQLLAKIAANSAAAAGGGTPPTTGSGGSGAFGAAATTFDLTTSGAGTIPAGYYYAEIYNAGNATGVVNSQSLPVATVKSYPTIPGVYLPAITYDATGTILVITAVRA